MSVICYPCATCTWKSEVCGIRVFIALVFLNFHVLVDQLVGELRKVTYRQPLITHHGKLSQNSL
jgi:hypothetical protein